MFHCSTRSSFRAMIRSSCSPIISSLTDMPVPFISFALETFRCARVGADDKRRGGVECPPDAAWQELVCHLSREGLSRQELDDPSPKPRARGFCNHRTVGLAPDHTEASLSRAVCDLPVYGHFALWHCERSILAGVGRQLV